MRLFISYARVDKPYCQQIVDTLDIHEVWYDHRLHAGQKWWEEILRRLAWCDGLIYLLSPDSVKSEYCQKELAIAEKLGKNIFPVLIHRSTAIPDSMRDIQYADLSNGLDAKAVKLLLNSIYIAERQEKPKTGIVPRVPLDAVVPPVSDPLTVIDEAAAALDAGEFDRAVFLLKRARELGYDSRFVDINLVLHEAESALEHQAYLREAEREYRPIVALVRRQRTFKLGCDAFFAFRKQFPDFDPEDLAKICVSATIPPITWCDIPTGEVIVEREKKRLIYFVEQYKISKYPVTDVQFQAFVDDPDGYKCEQWWNFAPDALAWHKQHLEPIEAKYDGVDYPRINVCWYEAVAYCLWLSDKTQLKIRLPSEQQWLRAARGDQQYVYPWGNRFDKQRCNTKESGKGKVTPVTTYPTGASPFDVHDMAGNIWEWCSTKAFAPQSGSVLNTPQDINYVVHGGSFVGTSERCRNTFSYKLKPQYRYDTIGFRIVCVE
jgi:hypothetical protein